MPLITRSALVALGLASALFGVHAPLHAQAPAITPKGDPSIRSDTIYRLAASPEQHPEQSTLVLLDDGVVKLEADGRAVTTYRQVVQILKESAVENYAEHSLSWVPGRQTLTVNWLRVVTPDGKVVSEKPSQVQDSDIPADLVDPVYSDERVRRLSLAGVAVGTIVDFSYTITDTKPFPPGDHFGNWTVSPGSVIRRSRLILDVPATLQPNIRERNLAFARQETVANGRRVYTWATADVARIRPELYAADSNGVYQSLAYALPRTWADIGTWYAGLAKDRYAMSAATRAKVRDIVAGAATREDSLRALHRWVAQDIRYVSVALGTGGYQPRKVDDVVRTGFGDCKDKATLFVAVLRDWGVRAHPVLLRTGRVDRALPTVRQFDHAIAAIEQPEGGYRFVDLTASRTPWGELPYSVEGEFALVVRDDGRVDEVTLPLSSIATNVNGMRLTGGLTPEGIFNGRYEESATGLMQYDLRNAFDAPLDSTKRANVSRALANSIYAGMTGDSLQVTVGKDLTTAPRISILLTGGKAATRAGETMILSLHVGNTERLAMVADQLEAQAPRRFSIDAEGIFGPNTRASELRFTLPDGWTARLPESVHATSVFGEFHSEYALEGRDLVIRRRIIGARGVYAPERLPDLTAWMRAMAKDDTRFIILEPLPKGGAR